MHTFIPKKYQLRISIEQNRNMICTFGGQYHLASNIHIASWIKDDGEVDLLLPVEVGLVLDGEDQFLLLLLVLLPHQNSNCQEVSKDCQKGGGLIRTEVVRDILNIIYDIYVHTNIE